MRKGVILATPLSFLTAMCGDMCFSDENFEHEGVHSINWVPAVCFTKPEIFLRKTR